MFRVYTLPEIRNISIGELRSYAKEIGVKGPTTLSKEELEHAVYEKVMEIKESRMVPSDLRCPKSRAGAIDRSSITIEDRDLFDPYAKKNDKLSYEPFEGWFCPYEEEDGIVSRKFVPYADDDIFVNESFVQRGLLTKGDYVTGLFAVSPYSGVKMLARIDSVNGLDLNTRRAADIDAREKLPMGGGLPSVADNPVLHALPFAAPFKKGARILLAHSDDCTLTDYARTLSESLEKSGMTVLRAYFGIMPEDEQALSVEKNATVCPFDLNNDHVKHVIYFISEAAARFAESGKDVAVVVDGLEYIDDFTAVRSLMSRACNMREGSITVFATVNEGIMDSRSFGILSSVVHAKVCFTKADELVIDFKKSSVRSDWQYYPQFFRLKQMLGSATLALIRNCKDPSALVELLK